MIYMAFHSYWREHKLICVSQRFPFSAPFGWFFFWPQVVFTPDVLVRYAGNLRKILCRYLQLFVQLSLNTVFCRLMPLWPTLARKCFWTKGDLSIRCGLGFLSKLKGILGLTFPISPPSEKIILSCLISNQWKQLLHIFCYFQ